LTNHHLEIYFDKIVALWRIILAQLFSLVHDASSCNISTICLL